MLVSEFKRQYGGDCQPCRKCSDYRREAEALLFRYADRLVTALCKFGKEAYDSRSLGFAGSWYEVDPGIIPLSNQLLVTLSLSISDLGVDEKTGSDYLDARRKLSEYVRELSCDQVNGT